MSSLLLFVAPERCLDRTRTARGAGRKPNAMQLFGIFRRRAPPVVPRDSRQQGIFPTFSSTLEDPNE